MNKTPNILMIVSDPVKTPNIDKLASEGMWFEKAYTPIPLCSPARQALLNGRRPETFGGLWNYHSCLQIPALEPDEYTWTKEIKELGYQEGYVGKWHVNPEYNPTNYGFDEYVSESDYSRFRKENYSHIRFDNGWFGEEDPVPLRHSRTHWMAESAIKLINKYKGKPWHIRLDFSDPHLPCRPSNPFSQMYDSEKIPQWRSFADEFNKKPYIQKQQLLNWGVENYTWEDWAPIVARYYGIISQMDDAIGMVLDKLNELFLEEDTIVIYTTDHGDMCGGHKMMDKHYILYEDVVRVPFIIKWPGTIKAGSVCSKYVYNFLDIQPTLLEAVGIEPKDFFHGQSLLPLLKGEDTPDWRNEIVSTYNGQQFGLYTQRMIKNDKWKYIWNTTDVDELYDMEIDPDELNNLINEEKYFSVISKLRKKLYLILKSNDDGMVKNEWMKKQLLDNKKIGY